MANSRGTSGIRSMMYAGRNTLLPPKSPLPIISPTYSDYVPGSVIDPKMLENPKEGNIHHQRTSSGSFLVEEQPSWLDELLNEPETPVRRGGHRRSSSDSFAYFDTANLGSMNFQGQNDNKFKDITPLHSWGSQDLDTYRSIEHYALFMDPKNKGLDTSMSSVLHPHGLRSLRDATTVTNAGSSRNIQDAAWNPALLTGKVNSAESCSQMTNNSSEEKDSSHAIPSASEVDTKRAKQQFAQRSRVRKLQYIAELERNVHTLQAEGSEVFAEMEFINQQNLILSMENNALKQRLESLAQEQLIKYMEHEVLEREVERLRTLYQQQQQSQHPQQISSSHRRTNSKDLDKQFANLSLKHKGAGTGQDSMPGQLHT